MLTPPQPAISNHGLETTLYKPLALQLQSWAFLELSWKHVRCPWQFGRRLKTLRLRFCRASINYAEKPRERNSGKVFRPYGRKCGENLAKNLANFRPSISRRVGRKKPHEKSAANSTSLDTKFFHRETLGAWGGHNYLRQQAPRNLPTLLLLLPADVLLLCLIYAAFRALGS